MSLLHRGEVKRAVLVLALVLPLPAVPAGADWPSLVGPDAARRFEASALPAGATPRLELAWRVPLGSGYSGVAVAGERLVTMFTDGPDDVVAAFDAGSGEEVWRRRLDALNPGRDGSQDGPLSTPVVFGDTVFALAPRGRLLALRLDDGEALWERSIRQALGAREPDFGFGTTPIVAGDALVLLAGAPEGGAIVALDPATGETLWSRGDGQVDYQSPVALTLAGRPQVVAVAGKTMTGFEPATGQELWSHGFGDEDYLADATPVAAGPDRFAVFVSGQLAMFEASAENGRIGVRELYRSKELGNTYALPVYHQGHLYGFRGQILSCVSAETGERVWRSRPPGGRGLLLVGDRLVIFGAGGQVVVAEASPRGYVELARLAALDASGYTWPSYGAGTIFVRNLEQMAAVALTAEEAGEVAAAVTPASADEPQHELQRLLAAVEEAGEPQAAVEAWLASRDAFPVVDGEWVHFVWTGEADDLAITGTMIASGAPEAMAPVPGTNLYHRSYRLEPGTRWEYRFVRNFSERIPDPRNPRRVPGGWGGDMSELALEGYETPEHLAAVGPTEPRGAIQEVSFASEILGMERALRVYLPPGYATSEQSYPLLVVQDGMDWLEKGLMANTLDRLLGERAEPLVAVFVEQRNEWWLEAGGTGTDRYVDMLAQEMVPFLEQRYRLRSDAAARAVVGNLGFGLSSLYAALRHPQVFGKVGMQSVQLGLGSDAAVFELLSRAPRPSLAIYFDWNRWDVRNADGGIDVGADSRKVASALAEHGFPYAGSEIADSAGWGGWRARSDRILEALFPLPDESD